MLGGKRLRFTDEQRRHLALKAQTLSPCMLKELGHLVTPDTLCRWFRKYAGAKYDSSGQRRPGRPPKPQYIRDLVVPHLGGAFVQPSNDHAANGPLIRRERLGGLLNYYYREAA